MDSESSRRARVSPLAHSEVLKSFWPGPVNPLSCETTRIDGANRLIVFTAHVCHSSQAL